MGRELSRLSLANLFDLSQHVAVVTGGSGGFGRSVALGLTQARAAGADPRALSRALFSQVHTPAGACVTRHR